MGFRIDRGFPVIPFLSNIVRERGVRMIVGLLDILLPKVV
jgi:hypothetical protein